MNKNIVVFITAETTSKSNNSETNYYAERTIIVPSYEADIIDSIAVDLYKELLAITPNPVSYYDMQDKGVIDYEGGHAFELILSQGWVQADWMTEEEYKSKEDA